MRLSLRRFLMVILTAAVLIFSIHADPAEAARRKKAARSQPDRFASIVIEASTGYVLSERNADKKLYPASLTKMMTLYLVFDALERGALTKNQRIYISKRAAAQEPSSLGLSPGDTIRVEDAVLALVTKSANDCAVALAEAVGGSESRFAQAMTMKARQLGMNSSHFVNASGLFNRAQISSARDMSTLALALLRDHPNHYHYFSTSAFSYKGNTYMNHNKLLGVYPGMDGLKTGYVYASGYNLAASAVRNGTRLIGVVFGGQTAGRRNVAMAQLLNRGFANVNNIRVASLAPKPKEKPIPSRRPAGLFDDAEAAAEATIAAAPPAAASVMVDQGDTDFGNDADTASPAFPRKFIAALQPRSLNTDTIEGTVAASAAARGDWAIQVGAFSSRDAGVRALQFAKLSLRGIVSGVDSIAPLMTSRGMIYRARLSGMARNDAAQACKILQGNCLILATE